MANDSREYQDEFQTFEAVMSGEDVSVAMAMLKSESFNKFVVLMVDELKKHKLALKLSREDLSFAVKYAGMDDPGNRRLGYTIEFITKTLGDHEFFKTVLKKWDKEDREFSENWSKTHGK